MRIGKYIFSTGLLIAALAWTLWFVFAGFGNHQDPLYWLYKYEHLEGGWLAVGTLLAGGGVVRLFGAQLLPLRLMGWLCVVIAIALPYCCLLNKEQRRNNLHWLAITYLLMGYGAFQEFSPGTLSVILLSAIWVCTAKSPITNYKSEILTAILVGLAIAVRFPNILVLLILIPLWRKRNLWLLPLVALSAGMVYLLGALFVTPATADAAMNSHELQSMFVKLWTNGGKLIGYILLAVGVVAIGQWNAKKGLVRGEITGLMVGALLCYFIAYTIKPLQWYNIDLTYLVSAFCLVLALSNFPFSIFHFPFSIGAIILMIATFGTDTAWLKLFPAVLCLLPVAGASFDKPMRRYLWPLMSILALTVAVRFAGNSIGQSDLSQATTICSIPPYKGIAIRDTENEWLLQLQSDYTTITSDQRLKTNAPLPILSLGQQMHLMRAVTGCEAAKYNEFWSNIFDSVYTEKYRAVIQEEQPIIFCSFSPQFKTKPTCKDKQSRLENMLREEGYSEIDRSQYKYMIYLPPSVLY